jgi:hypothetical protein
MKGARADDSPVPGHAAKQNNAASDPESKGVLRNLLRVPRERWLWLGKQKAGPRIFDELSYVRHLWRAFPDGRRGYT